MLTARLPRHLVFTALLLLCAAPLLAEEGEEKKKKKPEEDEVRLSLTLDAMTGRIPMVVDYLEAHFKQVDFGTLQASDIRPANATEANGGVDYFAAHSRVGPRFTLRYGDLFRGFFSLGLTQNSLNNQFSPGFRIVHPPNDSVLTVSETETLRLDEGVDFKIGGSVNFEMSEKAFLEVAYALTFGLSKMHSGRFFLTEVQGEYSYFLHRFRIRAFFPLPVDDFGFITPLLGVGGILYRAKAEFGQRDGIEDWRMEWTQENGLALEAGLSFTSGRLTGGITACFFGERSLSLTFGLAL